MNYLNDTETMMLLQSYKLIKADIKAIHMHRELMQTMPYEYDNDSKLKELGCLISVLKIWLMLLLDEERFIIERHIIEGVDWSRFSVEFSRKWSNENSRSERTLKRKQSKLITKSSDYSNKTFGEAIISIIKRYLGNFSKDQVASSPTIQSF